MPCKTRGCHVSSPTIIIAKDADVLFIEQNRARQQLVTKLGVL